MGLPSWDACKRGRASGDMLHCERLNQCGAGTLPPHWSALNLEVLNLDRNALSGVSPKAIHAPVAAPTFIRLIAPERPQEILSCGCRSPCSVESLLSVGKRGAALAQAVFRLHGAPTGHLPTSGACSCLGTICLARSQSREPPSS